MGSRTTSVMIEWRTNDDWHEIQQKYPRKYIKPEGPLAVGQQVKAKHNGRWHDAVIVESGKSSSTTKGKDIS